MFFCVFVGGLGLCNICLVSVFSRLMVRVVAEFPVDFVWFCCSGRLMLEGVLGAGGIFPQLLLAQSSAYLGLLKVISFCLIQWPFEGYIVEK